MPETGAVVRQRLRRNRPRTGVYFKGRSMRHGIRPKLKLRDMLLLCIAVLMIAGAIVLWFTVAAAKN